MIIDAAYIQDILNKTKRPSEAAALAIIEKGRLKRGLELEDAASLLNVDEPGLTSELFRVASAVKDEIYGERLVFFAPLYISDYCVNDCEYCNFHRRNRELKRRRLSPDDIEGQVKILLGMGHKRLLLEIGEDPLNNGIDYVVEAIDKIYSVKADKGDIRRLNVNMAATTVENYRKLKSAKIGTYQLFQETYHKPTYKALHDGPKSDYDRQITAHLRAFEAGLDDLGIGVLFGLYDWRFEVLGLIAHAKFLEGACGVGPHTISVPRFRPGPSITYSPKYPVSDADFLKLIAILRLAVPYTGMILSTREVPHLRRAAFRIGISQASASSATSVGGYGRRSSDGQFAIFDERPLKEVIDSVLDDNLLPSFCTACYRAGRTGEVFMRLSKPGEIHKFCRPNGILTFVEYLEDFASDGIYDKGYRVVEMYLKQIEDVEVRSETKARIDRIRRGHRDLYF